MLVMTDDDRFLIQLYSRQSVPLDRLPYTTEFENLFALYVEQSCRKITRNEVWRRLVQIRKAKQLPKKEIYETNISSLRKMGRTPRRHVAKGE